MSRLADARPEKDVRACGVEQCTACWKLTLPAARRLTGVAPGPVVAGHLIDVSDGTSRGHAGPGVRVEGGGG
ncbi:hypothetical protein, partial [Streptomyces sp. ADI91-18]|uniref:hypothetical protein n=1 Tax=Streptomyces sp. ADI91-18 TaxID=1522755 RepID=UPI0019D2F94E